MDEMDAQLSSVATWWMEPTLSINVQHTEGNNNTIKHVVLMEIYLMPRTDSQVTGNAFKKLKRSY